MDSAIVIFTIIITLQNILDCNGVSLRDQLVRLLIHRRAEDKPEDLQIYVQSTKEISMQDRRIQLKLGKKPMDAVD